ncbi:hypothetical protein GRI97_05625 [Altererythrobacter xixiisoli]|uniref:Uncharacterized protein n=1 Tax=Croceibacterium xixiisoli TaxID=1476466 RepID=A0A6I4TQL8_9SPHN|nr:hypothetical protein [Croceibacterium xixiisoli]MXO98465.1 hypothetical protein [Croceibacterium xixiisoli]
MALPPPQRLASLGLGGDGDEVVAIENVEHCFGVQLDYDMAPNWRTVGDVFTALQSACQSAQQPCMPPAPGDDGSDWHRFAEAICAETGVAPDRIDRDTLLLRRHWHQQKHWPLPSLQLWRRRCSG